MVLFPARVVEQTDNMEGSRVISSTIKAERMSCRR